MGVAGVVAVGLGDVRVACQAKEPDGEASQAGHDPGRGPGSDQGFVFAVGDIADPVELVLDVPVLPHPGSQGVGVNIGGAGDEIDDLGGAFPGVLPGNGPPELSDLAGSGDADPVGDRGDLDRAPASASPVLEAGHDAMITSAPELVSELAAAAEPDSD